MSNSNAGDSRYNEGPAAWEPVAAALRAAGFDATADDGGHANYGVFVKIDANNVDHIFVGVEPGGEHMFGYDIVDTDALYVGGESLPELNADSTPEQIAAAIATAANDLRR